MSHFFSIVNLPYFCIIILILWSVLKKEKFFLPSLLAFSFSLSPILFSFIEEDIRAAGNFTVGLKVGLYASIVGTVPLAIFGWYLGKKLTQKWTIILIVLGFFSNLSVVKAYQYMINKNSKLIQKEIVFDCNKLPYHCAIKNNKLDQIVALKKSGFDIEVRDSLSRTPLWYAVENEKAVQLLLENGAKADAFNIYGETPLAHSLVISLTPNFKIAKLLIESGAQINRSVGFRKPISILNFAIVSENYAAVNFALENGADPNVSDGYRRSACQRLEKIKSKITYDWKKICK